MTTKRIAVKVIACELNEYPTGGRSESRRAVGELDIDTFATIKNDSLSWWEITAEHKGTALELERRTRKTFDLNTRHIVKFDFLKSESISHGKFVHNFLKRFHGKIVSVYVGEKRSGFASQISIKGKLEYCSAREQYRILNDNLSFESVAQEGIVSEVTSYCYFSPSDVISYGTYGEEKYFKDGSEAVIKLSLHSPKKSSYIYA